MCLSWDELLLRLLGDDYNTGCTITVIRTGSTAEAGYSENDEGEEDNIADDNTCNSFAAQTTV